MTIPYHEKIAEYVQQTGPFRIANNISSHSELQITFQVNPKLTIQKNQVKFLVTL